MSRYAIVKNGSVDNIVLADASFIAGLQSATGVLIPDTSTATIGDMWDGVTFTKPPAPPTPVPQAVTMRQARLALYGAGLLATVNSAIAGMTGAQGEAARIEWEFSSEVKRNQPLVMALAPVLGMTQAQLDQLFITAAGL